jgi:hypothetical protein
VSKILASLAFTVLATSAFPAIAQLPVPAAPQAQPVQPKEFDPVVCERQEEIGSRLTSRKVCHTRSQWAQIRQDERGAVEHIQSERSMNGADGK